MGNLNYQKKEMNKVKGSINKFRNIPITKRRMAAIQKKQNKDKKRNILIIAVASILLVGLLGGGIYGFTTIWMQQKTSIKTSITTITGFTNGGVTLSLEISKIQNYSPVFNNDIEVTMMDGVKHKFLNNSDTAENLSNIEAILNEKEVKKVIKTITLMVTVSNSIVVEKTISYKDIKEVQIGYLGGVNDQISIRMLEGRSNLVKLANNMNVVLAELRANGVREVH